MLRRAITLGVTAMGMAAIAATSSMSSAEEGIPGGELVIISTEVPRHFNPAVQSGIATMMPGAQIFAMLLRADDEWNIEPYLAKSWEVADDGLSITFQLRDDARFHDGEPVTSADVKFSIEAQQEHHPFQTALEAVSKITTPDDHTVVLELSQPHPALLLAMSTSIVPIIPEHIYNDGQDLKTHPRNTTDVVGSGPFKLAEYSEGEHIILERNDDFFLDGRPYLDRIVVRIIGDDTSRILAMETGEGHLHANLAETRHVLRLRENEDLVVTERGYEAIGAINWLAFNTKAEPLDDVRVRQAIAYAVDRDFITKALHRGISQQATGPIVPSSPFYTADVETYDLDLEKANALLDEAGHPQGADGVRFDLTVDYLPGSPEQQRSIAEYLKPQLKKIGIDVQVRNTPDFPTWSNRISNHDFDMTMDLVFNWGDPVIGVHRTYLCDNIKKGVIWSNTQQYCNKEADDILSKAGQAIDPQERAELYAEFQQIVTRDLPIYWINVAPYHTVYAKGLGNPPLTVWGTIAPLDEVYWKSESN